MTLIYIKYSFFTLANNTILDLTKAGLLSTFIVDVPDNRSQTGSCVILIEAPHAPFTYYFRVRLNIDSTHLPMSAALQIQLASDLPCLILSYKGDVPAPDTVRW